MLSSPKIFLLKNIFQVALQYLLNIFILFNTVSYLKLNFKLKVDPKMCIFNNLEEIWKTRKKNFKMRGNSEYNLVISLNGVNCFSNHFICITVYKQKVSCQQPFTINKRQTCLFSKVCCWPVLNLFKPQCSEAAIIFPIKTQSIKKLHYLTKQRNN